MIWKISTNKDWNYLSKTFDWVEDMQHTDQNRDYHGEGKAFAWNATNITRLMRKQLIDLFTTYDARVKIIYLERPFNTWLEQNRNREYQIPQNVLDKLLRKLEIPQVWEAHEVEYQCD